ncbi:MAG: hypothetical protein JRJ85_14100 [Deltaproteobacteria bacterium]|nr:hypothetical protein [Deltaproteobacteria bacterium]
MEPFDYLCIGHVTRDLTADGPQFGGTVLYSGLTARALGEKTAVVTSAMPDAEVMGAFRDISLSVRHAKQTTTFENMVSASGRHQVIHGVAEPLGLSDVPPGWRTPTIIHLGPVADEVDPELIYRFRSEIIGLTPQGWHRCWDSSGEVTFTTWKTAREILPLATAVIVSVEDIGDENTWDLYRHHCHLLVMTSGADGCTVRYRNKERHFPTLRIPEKDATGAGDIFAAAFFIRFHETAGDPWEAARFATRLAGPSVTRKGLGGIPGAAEVEEARLL